MIVGASGPVGDGGEVVSASKLRFRFGIFGLGSDCGTGQSIVSESFEKFDLEKFWVTAGEGNFKRSFRRGVESGVQEVTQGQFMIFCGPFWFTISC